MPNRLLLAATLVAAIAIPNAADAAPSWHLGPPNSNTSICSGGGLTTFVGYHGEVTPKTGDPLGYVGVVVDAPPCQSTNNIVTVIPDFHLPEGMVQDTSRAVECYRRLTTNGTGQPLSDFPAAEGQCSNQPLQYQNLQNIFGWSSLKAGERFEVMVPVMFVKKTTAATFWVDLQSNWTPLAPNIQFAIDYQPRFSNYGSVGLPGNGSQMQVSLHVDHFFAGSTLYIDYGTSTMLGSSVTLTTLDAQYMFYDLTGTINGLIGSGTTYYWRARIVGPYGTFVGDIQTGYTCYRRQCAVRRL